ncbi:hypothetical protein BCR32DRAFT_13221 [Anaeromyces robustus]|uniref:G-protein coupled receptors family 3 profile domain-containing protein n=1 Tax=Anaeromyces robustus TaxID=1754192 RepID=A0A1Y1X5Z4_9FUNG|nr:hypothetical protein BCR32DRAFT_13221 [Anaeromyces robustus]|eukprot:ORX81231.1 hypothetical protein BCR32DRAFT_13221 [Anaeromyces robustus]
MGSCIITFLSIFIIILLDYVNSKEIIVNSETSFLNAINNEYNDIIIDNDVIINTEFKSTVSHLTIKGNLKSSTLQFNNKAEFINGNILNFHEITIRGNVTINYSTVNLESINFYGHMNIVKTTNDEGKININNSIFTLYGEEEKCFFNIGNYDTIILNSEFYSGSDIHGILVHYDGGEDKFYELFIEGSKFIGKYTSSGIDISHGNVKIINSIFDTCSSYSSTNSKGGSLTGYAANIKISRCTFSNGFSNFDGGAFFISQMKSFLAEDLTVLNVTSRFSGGLLYSTTPPGVESHAVLKNIKHIGSGGVNISDVIMTGVIACLTGYATLEIDTYYGENFNTNIGTGSMFVGGGDTQMNIKNLYLNNISGGPSSGAGLLITTYNPITTGVTFELNNCSIKNANQKCDKDNSLLTWCDKGTFTINNCVFENFKGSKSYIHYQSNESRVTFNNVKFMNVFSKIPTSLINHDSSLENAYLDLNKFSLTNVTSQGEIFKINVSDLKITDSNFTNIHTCITSNSCINSDDRPAIGLILNTGKLYITNTIFNNIYGSLGFSLSSRSSTEISKSTFINNNYMNGIFSAVESTYISLGDLLVKDTLFDNNYSTRGTIIHIDEVKLPTDLKSVKFENCNFKNNYAVKQGGISYSISSYSNQNIIFDNCKFNNNTSKLGNISYSYNRLSEPQFININNINELKTIDNNFITNPQNLIMDTNSLKVAKIYSGNVINETFSFKMYDDYNHLITYDSDIDNAMLDDLIFYSITVNDTNNVKLLGQIHGYCWNTTCSFSNVKAIGMKGKYQLAMNIITFGQYLHFENNTAYSELIIEDCPRDNKQYIERDVEGINIKSCYIKKCDPQCVTGQCIGDNICNCTDPRYIGRLCEEPKALERNTIFNYLIFIISYMLIFISILLIIGIIYYREDPNIKGGSVEFLIIILIGTIFNYIYVLLLLKNRTRITCTMILFFYYIGFCLVFGSILAKTLRVYKISKILSSLEMNITQNQLYGIVIGITLYHVIIILICVKTNQIKLKEASSEYYIYQKCEYSKIKYLR